MSASATATQMTWEAVRDMMRQQDEVITVRLLALGEQLRDAQEETARVRRELSLFRAWVKAALSADVAAIEQQNSAPMLPTPNPPATLPPHKLISHEEIEALAKSVARKYSRKQRRPK